MMASISFTNKNKNNLVKYLDDNIRNLLEQPNS